MNKHAKRINSLPKATQNRLRTYRFFKHGQWMPWPRLRELYRMYVKNMGGGFTK